MLIPPPASGSDGSQLSQPGERQLNKVLDWGQAEGEWDNMSLVAPPFPLSLSLSSSVATCSISRKGRRGLHTRGKPLSLLCYFISPNTMKEAFKDIDVPIPHLRPLESREVDPVQSHTTAKRLSHAPSLPSS